MAVTSDVSGEGKPLRLVTTTMLRRASVHATFRLAVA